MLVFILCTKNDTTRSIEVLLVTCPFVRKLFVFEILLSVVSMHVTITVVIIIIQLTAVTMHDMVNKTEFVFSHFVKI